MSTRCDVIVIGTGPGGEEAAGRLIDAGREVTVIERELIGGECAYWACIPSKTLLRPPEARRAASRAAGTSRPQIDWPELVAYRDYMIRNLDDAAQVDSYKQRGVRVVKGSARLIAKDAVAVGEERFEADHIIVATGSRPVVPTVEGMAGEGLWTNREATTLTEIPASALVLGGSAVGIELGEFLARMGSTVTLVQRPPRLIDREEPRVGELVEAQLRGEGIDVRTSCEARSATRNADRWTVELSDGGRVEAEVIVVGTGRQPNTEDLGLEEIGVALDERGGVRVDEHCQAAEGIWAVGDVTNRALFTHVAMYQGRVAADNILGRPRTASYEGIPRVVFADPEIAAVGLTEAEAAARGIRTVRGELDLAESISRPWTYETEPTGTLGVLVDRDARVLVGAWAVAPLAAEWIHQAALAIRARLPFEVLVDQVAQFPTYCEGYVKALEALDWS